jgi:hypothetical protein
LVVTLLDASNRVSNVELENNDDEVEHEIIKSITRCKNDQHELVWQWLNKYQTCLWCTACQHMKASMTNTYKAQTPIEDGVHKSTSKAIPKRLSRVRQTGKGRSSTPSSSDQQNTLTQMDFGTPRRFALDAQIADSDEEEESTEARPTKRVKTEIVPSTLALQQSTLTQMDFVKLMRQGIPDSEEEDIEDDSDLENFEKFAGKELGQSLAQRKTDVGREEIEEAVLDGFTEEHAEDLADTRRENRQSNASRLIAVQNSTDEIDDKSSSPAKVPTTPRRPRTETVPSSQTPPATPISIPGSKERPFQSSTDDPPASPTPIRMGPPNLPRPRPSPMAPPALPVPQFSPLAPPHLSMPGRSPLKQKDANADILAQTQSEFHTQTQTQTSPITKQRVQDFNQRWAELTGNYDNIPANRRSKKPTKPQHESFDMGDATQAELLGINLEEYIGLRNSEQDPYPLQPIREDTETKPARELVDDTSVPATSPVKKNEIIVIPSSQDDEYVPASSPMSEDRPALQDSVVPASSPQPRKVFKDLQLESTNHMVPDTQLDIQFSQTSIRPSQASTAPATPTAVQSKAVQNIELPSPSRQLFEESGRSPLQLITISQLIPSSLIASVPRPHDSESLSDEESGDEEEEL